MSVAHVRPWVATIAGILLSALLLVLAVRTTDAKAIGDALKAIDPWYALPFLAALFLYYWIKTVRWADLLAPVTRAGPRRLFPPVMIGYAGSALLPLQLGEVARSFLVARRERLPGSTVLMTIAIERVFDLLGILLLLGGALALGSELPPVLVKAGYVIAVGALAAGSVLAAYVFRPAGFIRWTRRVSAVLPNRAAEWIVRQAEHGARGLGALRDARLLARVTIASLLQWLFMWACVWLSIAAAGIEASVGGAFVVLVLTVIGISLPNSPGYVGSIQMAYVLGLTPFGVDAAFAIAASLFFHVLAYASVVIVGLVFLQFSGSNFTSLMRAARDPGES